MAFFEQIGKRISDAGQGVAQQTKNFTEVTRLNNMISDAEKEINQIFLALGQTYYQNHKDDPSAEERETLDRLNALYANIAQYGENINKIKGTGSCPSCGAAVPAQAAFCNACGAKIERSSPEAAPAAGTEDQRLCPNCQAPVPAGNLFCVKCGTKVEDQ